MRELFEIDTGLTKSTTDSACIHIADENMHVWSDGIAWSVHLNKGNMDKFISMLCVKEGKHANINIGGTHIWREDIVESDSSDNRSDIVFDAGLCRNIICLKQSALKLFIDYLKANNNEC